MNLQGMERFVAGNGNVAIYSQLTRYLTDDERFISVSGTWESLYPSHWQEPRLISLMLFVWGRQPQTYIISYGHIYT